MSPKIKILFLLFLNLSLSSSLRFFQSRKRKKKCIVKDDEWNSHYITCTSKYQKCCETGCCDSAINSVAATYVKVGIVCSVIAMIFLFIYMEMWCKRKCTNIKKKCQNCRTSPENDLRNEQEMENLGEKQDNEEKWNLSEITKSDDDDESLSAVCCDSNQ